MSQIKAELISNMGSDLMVVNSARVSFDKESEFVINGACGSETLSDKDCKLISYLAKHKHFTPFTHPQITLRETVPIFVARQRFKHVVGFTYNEVSRRYVDDEPSFYVPKEWRSRPEGSVKQGSGGRCSAMYESEPTVASMDECYIHHINTSINLYNNMIKIGVAPEQARMVLPQSMMTSYYVTGSLAAFARAYSQRIDSHAQREIQMLAEKWGAVIEPLYPVSWGALTCE